MQIKTTAGTMAEISNVEAERIASHVMSGKSKMKNCEYLSKARNTISKIIHCDWPEDEDEKKEIIYHALPGFSREDAAFLYEIMEEVAAMHYKRVAE